MLYFSAWKNQKIDRVKIGNKFKGAAYTILQIHSTDYALYSQHRDVGRYSQMDWYTTVEGSNPSPTNINVFIYLFFLVLFRFFIFYFLFFIGFLFETQVYENHYSKLSSIRGAKFLIHPAIFLKLIFITEKKK